MTPEEYQNAVARTCATSGRDDTLTMTTIGLAGETGEVCDAIKKYLFHQHPLQVPALTSELGDVLWYLTAICNVLQVDLEDVMEKNVQKLRKRYPVGFDSQRSLHREQGDE